VAPMLALLPRPIALTLLAPRQAAQLPTPHETPVGGRLGQHVPAWQQICSNPWLLRLIKHGVEVDFLTPPFQPRLPPECKPTAHRPTVTAEIEAALGKQALEPCEPMAADRRPHQAFYHKVFTVPKAGTTQHRLITSMTAGNAFCRRIHFKMEGYRELRQLLQPGEWMGKIDIKDAFFHVPLAQHVRDFFRVRWQGVHYRATALPFGFVDSPRLFTKVMRAALEPLRARGIRLIVYLDDILVIGASPAQCMSHLQQVVNLLHGLGFSLHPDKCQLLPEQQIDFLGFQIDSVDMMIRIPHRKRVALREQLHRALQQAAAGRLMEPRALAQLVGRLQSLSCALNLAAPMLRAAHRDIPRRLHRSLWDQPLVRLSTETVRDLTWFRESLLVWTGSPLRLALPTRLLTTDASPSGWGAWISTYDQPARPLASTWQFWPTEDARRSSNWREAQGTHLGLQAFRSQLAGHHVLVRTDNTCNVVALAKGGVATAALAEVARSTLLLASQLGCHLSVTHLPGVDNWLADELSRVDTDYSDFKLHPALFEQLQQRWRCDTDLFATYANTQLPRFFSQRPDPMSAGIDAFLQPWRHMAGYANPPFALIGRVLAKVRDEQATITLVAPVWRSSPWWPLMLQMLVDYPVRIPLRPQTFLPGFLGSALPLLTPQWPCGAFRISGAPTAPLALPTAPSTSWWPSTGHPPPPDTTATGTASWIGPFATAASRPTDSWPALTPPR